MQKSIISGLALAAIFGVSAALAQDADQWAGIYAGLSYNSGSADQSYSPSSSPFELEGDAVGVMVGYNYATGPWVIGAELAYSNLEIGQTDGDPYNFESFLDLKGRAGYAMDKVLFYGTFGGTLTKWNEGGSSFDGGGMLYGVGVDYLVSPQFVVGAEYLRRDVTSEYETSGDTFDADVDTFSLRLNYKF
jgi:outer membrane immunogenic protein